MSVEALESTRARLDELKTDLVIHLKRLEQDCASQPTLCEEVASIQADLKGELSRAEWDLEQLRSRRSLEIRSDPDTFGLTKITESAVKDAINTCEDVDEAQRLIADLDALYRKASGLVDAFDQRRSMISNAVSLYTHEYYTVLQPEAEGEAPKRKFTDGERKSIIEKIKKSRGGSSDE